MDGKQLLLLRHAKSSWREPGLSDHDRPLNGRGRRSAPLIGRYLVQQGLQPDLVLCSTALRTRETWDLVAETLGQAPPPCELHGDLYEAEPSKILRTIRRVPATVRRLLVVGHNPGMELLARSLADARSERVALARLQAKYPTAGLALFDLGAAGWGSLEKARLVSFTIPADLQASS